MIVYWHVCRCTVNFVVLKQFLSVHRSITYLPYSDTGYYSKLVTDYLSSAKELQSFYRYQPDADGLAEAIADRAKYPVERNLLADLLEQQYHKLDKSTAVEENLQLLRKDNTYTVCTAHQPNLLTGYLYFVYKILHAIKLAEELKQQHPDKNFVPVYYMGSEDNDLEELGRFRYGGEKYIWDGDGQTGAVGRMKTKSLKPLLHQLFRVLGPPTEHTDHLKNLLEEAYLDCQTIGAATQKLVNALFGRYGLIVIDADEADFKRQVLPILIDDLKEHTPHSIVSQQIENLSEHYKSQAHPRPINLFYLTDTIRERIEKEGDEWVVLNTTIRFTAAELDKELQEHPERFSPNVILRGILQESILPNVAFIGGGAEVAYWLQLKTLFDHYNVFYPAVLLRQSVLWGNPKAHQLRKQLGFAPEEVFKSIDELSKEYIAAHTHHEWETKEEYTAIEEQLLKTKAKAAKLDSTLEASAEAALTRIRKQMQVLEQKMLRAEKRKMEVQMERIQRMKDELFPNGSLQERTENFISFYPEEGQAFFDVIKDATKALDHKFLFIENEQ